MGGAGASEQFAWRGLACSAGGMQAVFGCELAPQMALVILMLSRCCPSRNHCAGNSDWAVCEMYAFQVTTGSQMFFDKILINVLGSTENKI